MPSYWPDKPHNPAHRRPFNKLLYRLYIGLGPKRRPFTRLWSEAEVFRILRALSRQQVHGFIENPEGGEPIWSLDAPEDVQENRIPLNTCLLRGWIEELKMGGQSFKGFPIAKPLLAPGQTFDSAFSKPPYYRLTTAGWNALYRSYAVSRIALVISLVALSVSLSNLLHKAEPPVLKVSFPVPNAPPARKPQP